MHAYNGKKKREKPPRAKEDPPPINFRTKWAPAAGGGVYSDPQLQKTAAVTGVFTSLPGVDRFC